jgi:hypothetical protein
MASGPGDLRQVDLVHLGLRADTGSVLIAILLHASTNLFLVSPVITDGLGVPILFMIAKWLLVLIIGLALRRQTRRNQTSPVTRPQPNSDD